MFTKDPSVDKRKKHLLTRLAQYFVLKVTFVNLLVKVKSINFRGLYSKAIYCLWLIPYPSQPAKRAILSPWALMITFICFNIPGFHWDRLHIAEDKPVNPFQIESADVAVCWSEELQACREILAGHSVDGGLDLLMLKNKIKTSQVQV